MSTVAGLGSAARLGPYSVISQIARGVGGIVVRGRHDASGDVVALKIAEDSRPMGRALLRREIATLSRLGHSRPRGIVRLLEHGLDQGVPWYAMELVEGGDARGWRRALWDSAGTGTGTIAAAGRLREVLAVFRRLAEALAFIHGEGIVHGDLAPRNVLFDRDGAPVLIDFATARRSFAGSIARELADGEVHLATPGYMAPEQIEGEHIDARCDLYAFGCLLFELLTDRQPFRADGVAALLRQHLRVPPPPPSQLAGGIPPALDALVLGLLEKEPRRRVGYAEDVAALLGDLGEAPAGGPSRRGREGRSVFRLYRPRLAGRAPDMARLEERLDAAHAGDGGCVFVSGESGVGKTRLVNELARRAAARGFEVLMSTCGGGTPEAPDAIEGLALQGLTPFLRWLADAWQAEEAAPPVAASSTARRLRDRLTAGDLAVLAPYEPALVGPAAGAAPLPAHSPEVARRRVVETLQAALRAAAELRPLLLVLDDLQWADDLTMALVARAARGAAGALQGARVLIVGTFRREQPPPELAAILEADPQRQVRLERLHANDTRAMVADMIAAAEVPPGLVELLDRHAGGNPFFIAEYLRAIIERELLVRDRLGRWTISDPAALGEDAVATPPSLQTLLDERLRGLSAAARELLDLAAVLGREFSGDLLDAFTGEPARGRVPALSVALEELVARQILEEPALDRYQFAHDKLRDAREAALSTERRRELHRRAAQLVEARAEAAPDPDWFAAEIGGHWAIAGDHARALDHLERAGRHAERVHASAQAVRLVALALREAEAGDDGAATRVVPLGERLADLLVRSARHPEARERYDRTLARVPPGEALTAARLLRKKGQSFWTLHEYAAASTALDAAEAHLGPVGEPRRPEEHVEWLEIARNRFFLLYFSRQVGGATQALIERMAAVAEQHGTASQRGAVFQCAAMEIMARTRYARSVEAVRFARRAEAEVAGDPGLALQWNDARFTLGLTLLLGNAAECAEAVPVLVAAAEEAQRTGEATLHSRALTYLAIARRRLGDLAATRAVAEATLRAADLAQLSPYLGAAAACLAWVSWRQGDLRAAAEHLARARAWWGKGPHQFPFRWLAGLVQLDLCHKIEDVAGATAVLQEMLDPQQQRFPERLQQAMEEAAAIPADDFHAANAALERVLVYATELGYL